MNDDNWRYVSTGNYRKRSERRVEKHQKTKKHRRTYVLRRLFFLVLLIGLGIAVYMGFLLKKSNDALESVSSEADPSIEVPASESVAVKPFAMLLLGLDSRAHLGIYNTDVMMVAAFNPATKKASIVSLPRDTIIELPGYKSHKVNSYYARFRAQGIHSGLDEQEASIQAKKQVREMLSQYLDVDIRYTTTINFQGFIDLVDAFGGVDVFVDMDMRYADRAGDTSINLRKGQQVLDGDQALDFVRYRKSNDGTKASSDFERNQRQAQVIGAITDKMKSMEGVYKLSKVVDAIGDNLRTDLPSAETVKFMKTYFGISKENIQTKPVTGEWRSPYVYPDMNSVEEAKTLLHDTLQETDAEPSE